MDKILKPELEDDEVAKLVDKVKITKVTKQLKPEMVEKPAQAEIPSSFRRSRR